MVTPTKALVAALWSVLASPVSPLSSISTFCAVGDATARPVSEDGKGTNPNGHTALVEIPVVGLQASVPHRTKPVGVGIDRIEDIDAASLPLVVYHVGREPCQAQFEEGLN